MILQGSLAEGISEEVLEFAAERDEELLRMYLDGLADEESAIRSLRTLVKTRCLFPVMCGSALQDRGVKEFLANLGTLAEVNRDSSGELSARAVKIRHDAQGVRLTHLKLLQGRLRVRDEIEYESCGGERLREKITSIRIYNGEKYAAVDEARAGQLVAVTGLASCRPGRESAISANESLTSLLRR
ncbi:Elongation factor G [Paenibacillus sp. P1XP2]|nr:Elongation factor G [Paenibacillus sp. P1XP2]